MEHVSKAQIKLVRSLQHKKFRDEHGLFVAEGDKCIDELRKGFELEYLIVEESLTSNSFSGPISNSAAVQFLTAKRSELEQMSGLRTPQGSIAVFRKSNSEAVQLPTAKRSNSPQDGLTLVLDGIQDPGNLGTIIRTCDWFGVKQIICSQDTADCYNPKVVQATMGALARVKLIYTDLVPFLQAEKVKGTNIFGTLLDGKNMYKLLSTFDFEQSGLSTIIIMGNEGNGISEEVRKWITHPLRIPSYPEGAETSESLNVAIATAIVLAEFRRA